MARRSLIAVAALSLAVGASSASAIGAYGVNDWRWVDAPSEDLSRLSSNNLRVFRANMYLQHSFSQIDGQLDRLARHNLTWLPVLISDYGSGGAAAAPVTTEERAKFAAFAQGVAVRYGPIGPGRGTFWTERGCSAAGCPGGLSYRPIEALEVWNEQNLPQFWPINPNDDASVKKAIEDYRELLRAVRNQVYGATPDVRLVSGGLTTSTKAYSPYSYIRRMSAYAGGSCLYDAAGFHPYTRATPDELSDSVADRFASKLDAFQSSVHTYAPDAPIYLTEWGWAVAEGTPLRSPSELSYVATTERKQSAYIEKALGKIRGNRSAWNLGLSTIFVHKDEDIPGIEQAWEYSGLRRANNTARPSWDRQVAVSQAASELAKPPYRCPPPPPPPPPSDPPPSEDPPMDTTH